ncbi:hypothetical protein JB92DRAFT_3085038 [Gautieria morchelliformis]|nr:hypothetical protein JB92DRAFT_3085038 [Gautieria morchelliformis]
MTANAPYSLLAALPPTIKQVLSSYSKKGHHEHEHAITTVHGWIKSVRRQKNVSFAVVNDGTTLKGLQAVFLQPETEQAAIMKRLTTGTSVRLTGNLVKSLGKGQDCELRVDMVEVLGDCEPERYPIQKKDHSLEFLRENAHLRARTSHIAAMLRVRDKLVHAFGDWFEVRYVHYFGIQYFVARMKNAGFLSAHAPVMTTNDCEGTGEAFRVMSVPADPISSLSAGPASTLETPVTFLTTSTQLHLEALTSSLARVYTIAPSFRAERSQTNRHLNEFWMLEAEMSFLHTGVHGVCDVVEASIKSVLGRLAEDEDVNFLHEGRHGIRPGSNLKAMLDISTPWRRISYSDALKALHVHHASGAAPRFSLDPPAWGGPLRSEHERWIADSLGGDPEKTQIGGPIFVTDYPRMLKPFYMWVNDELNEGEGKDARSTVACFDLLVPKLGELTGGSVRESRIERLKESMALHGVDEAHHAWYLDLRRYGTTPHGGFGVGFERLVSWICGIENVRECVPFPRWAGKVLL